MLTEKIKLESDEQVIIQVRKHWFILFLQLFNVVVLALFPLLVYLLLSYFATDYLGTLDLSAYTNLILYVYLAWLLIVWMIGFNVWTDYYLDVWTITNKRLITIDQRGLFYRTTGSFRLERLQDMNVEINGLIATFLDFGTLEAQTAAGIEDEFRAHGLPHPRELKSTILAAADNLMRNYGRSPNDPSGV